MDIWRFSHGKLFQIFTPFIYQRPEKRYPFRVEPPPRGHLREYPPPDKVVRDVACWVAEVNKTRSFCFRGRERTGTDVLSIIREGKTVGREVLCEQFIGYYTVALVICLHRLLSIESENHLQNGSQSQSRTYVYP